MTKISRNASEKFGKIFPDRKMTQMLIATTDKVLSNLRDMRTLADLMSAQGIGSIAGLAAASGVSDNSIRDMFSGKIPGSPKLWKRIADVLKVSVPDLKEAAALGPVITISQGVKAVEIPRKLVAKADLCAKAEGVDLKKWLIGVINKACGVVEFDEDE